MEGKACCIVSSRKIPGNRLKGLKQKLREEVRATVKSGFSTFISGLEDGPELMFAEIIASEKEKGARLF